MKESFLTDKIVTYIGNKRKLLSFIEEATNDVIHNDPYLSVKKPRDISFFDIFSGSGIVARWAKLKGYRVFSNDLENYSKVISDALIGTNDRELEGLFKKVAIQLVNLDSEPKNFYKFTLSFINDIAEYYIQKEKIPTNLDFLIDKETKTDFYRKQNVAYFSLHYAPKDMENTNVNFERERLFYTQRNARFIDAVIFVINNEPAFLNNPKAKNVILSELLYYMSVHNNTSGVMKGFHNGWGGKSKSALDRIMKPFLLEGVNLIDGVNGKSFTQKAEEVFEKEGVLGYLDDKKIDIIYADPPYNQHQYSANYHLLTSAVKNDKLDPGPVAQGTRAGIREDHNRSSFSASNKSNPITKENYVIDGKNVRSVEYSFIKFVRSLTNKGRYLIVSYNNEGLLTHQELMGILNDNEKNTVYFKTKTHDKFKGGKNTNVSNKVSEFIFIVQLGKKQSYSKLEKQIEELEKITFINLIDDAAFSVNALKSIENFTCFENANLYHIVDNNNYLLTLDKSLRVKSFNKDGFNMENISLINSCRIEKNELIEFYLNDLDMYVYNQKEVHNLLRSFKLTKFADYLPHLKSRIEGFEYQLSNIKNNI